MLSFLEIRQHVIDKLERNLSPALTYHNVEHTLDVLNQAEIIGGKEGVVGEDLLLLRVSALYHDVGFINTYVGHEEISCKVAVFELNKFGFNDQQIKLVIGMIRATKVPQLPQNLLEQVICDSDLDYLGRSDFFTIGECLYKEFKDQQIIANFHDWDLLQVNFLEKHHYFTNTSIQRRQKQKQQHLQAIKARVGISV